MVKAHIEAFAKSNLMMGNDLFLFIQFNCRIRARQSMYSIDEDGKHFQILIPKDLRHGVVNNAKSNMHSDSAQFSIKIRHNRKYFEGVALPVV